MDKGRGDAQRRGDDQRRGKRLFSELSGGGDRREFNSRLERERAEQRRLFGERDPSPRRDRDGDRRREGPPLGARVQYPRGRGYNRSGPRQLPKDGGQKKKIDLQAPGASSSPDPVAVDPHPDYSKVTCYNCGQVGHRQSDCTEEAYCVKCDTKGHVSAMCNFSDDRFDLYWAGYGRDGIGFMCLEVDVEELMQAPPNSATVYIEGTELTAEKVAEEFRELVDDAWDWQVRQLSAKDFALVFPSAGVLRMAIRGGGGGGLRLPFSKAQALVIDGAMDEQATEVLVPSWVKLHGIPPPYRNAARLRVGARPVGRPMLVDEGTFHDPKLPIRMQFGCWAGVKVAESFTLFVNEQGFKVRVEVESGIVNSKAP
ncbi:unnamed protein product [Alopecurus aequalis]